MMILPGDFPKLLTYKKVDQKMGLFVLKLSLTIKYWLLKEAQMPKCGHEFKVPTVKSGLLQETLSTKEEELNKLKLELSLRFLI